MPVRERHSERCAGKSSSHAKRIQSSLQRDANCFVGAFVDDDGGTRRCCLTGSARQRGERERGANEERQTRKRSLDHLKTLRDSQEIDNTFYSLLSPL